MGLEVKVGAVGDTLQLAPVAALETETVFDVHGALGVVGELLLGVLVETQVFGVNAQPHVPGLAVVNPVLVPFFVRARLHEELQLHLLKFAGAEDEVTGGDFVTEGLTYLANAKRRLLTRGAHNVGEVDENTLRGFRTQVVQAGFIIYRAQEGLK